MPNFYYLAFKYDRKSSKAPKKLMVKSFGDLKPLRDPHITFDLREMEFLLTGHWDIWIEYTIKDEKLIRVRKEVNCSVAIERDYPELYIMLTEFFSPNEPDETLLPQIYEMEKEYWARHDVVAAKAAEVDDFKYTKVVTKKLPAGAIF